MKTVIGVYNTHNEAIEAVKELKQAGFADKKISVIGKVNETIEGEEKNDTLMKVAGTELGITTIAGSTLGILTGIGIFAIPGLGFLYGAGALVGAIAGFDFGLIGGGIISALTIPGMKTDAAKKYEKELHEGKTIVIVQGTEDEIKRAQTTLVTYNKHAILEAH